MFHHRIHAAQRSRAGRHGRRLLHGDRAVGVKFPIAHAVDNAVGRRRVDIWCVPRRLRHILERTAVFGGEIQRADDNFCELRARKIRGWFKGCLCHAVENAVGRERFDRLLCCNSLCVGECWSFCQTRGMCRHAGLRGVRHFLHICHREKRGFTACLPDCRRKRAERLHGRVRVEAVVVAEAAVRELIGQELIENALAVFHKAAVVHRDPQRAEREHDLRAGLGAFIAPGGIAAVVILKSREPVYAEGNCIFDRGALLIGCERLQNHRRYVGVRFLRADGPAAVRELPTEHEINIHRPRGLRFTFLYGRNFIISAVERQQHVGCRCDPGLGRRIVIGKRRKQIIACDIPRIFADGREPENDARIFRQAGF